MAHRLKREIRLLLLAAFALSASASLTAQYVGPTLTSPPRPAGVSNVTVGAEHADIKIEPGDIVSIQTYGAPELTTTAQTSASTIFNVSAPVLQGVKVGARGEVVLPYVGAIKVAGLTPAEASAYLTKALKDGGFLVDPQVSVQFVDSPTRAIIVIGEVLKPAPVPAFGQIRLLDAISACGGFTPLASHTITVRRLGQTDAITVELGNNPKTVGASDIILLPGDTVVVPKVGSVYVVGQVKTPSAIPLSSNSPVTVLRAIAMAGGVNYGAGLSKTRIIRTTGDNQHVEIMLDLAKIMFGKQQDVVLESDDVLLVPTNAFKASLAAGAASVAASALYGLTYAVSLTK